MTVRVQVNCAMSLDGCIGLPGPKPLKISGPQDLRRVHRMRADHDAILVGIGTVLADDPKLTVKWDLLDETGEHPVRIVLDPQLRTPPNARVLDGTAPTIVFHNRSAGSLPGSAECVRVGTDAQGYLDLRGVLKELGARGLNRLMVEGGSTVIGAFLRNRLVDELTVYVGPMVVGAADAPRLYRGEPLTDVGLTCVEATPLGGGVLLRWLRA